MPTLNPRVNVTFNPSDAEVMKLICEKKNISMSSLVRKVVEDWLEEYEDMLLARRAEEVEREWIEGGSKTISHEELCQELGIESNIQNIQETTSKDSRKIFRKGSSEQSNEGSRSLRKSVNY
jgi:predicted DNA-binding protein